MVVSSDLYMTKLCMKGQIKRDKKLRNVKELAQLELKSHPKNPGGKKEKKIATKH